MMGRNQVSDRKGSFCRRVLQGPLRGISALDLCLELSIDTLVLLPLRTELLKTRSESLLYLPGSPY